MKIGIIGYGKMGKSVEKQALKRGHTVIVLPLPHPTQSKRFSAVDCVIDFSHADVALQAITDCLAENKHVVSGTTGWLDELEIAKKACLKHHAAFCWAPNFSLGMNIVLYINGVLADIMNQFEEYVPSLTEIHHSAKKDIPSGTAISLADQIVRRIERTKTWELKNDQPKSQSTLTIDAQREKDVKGIHEISYESLEDIIGLRHHALSRDGFAIGAILAAEWLQGKTGYFSFEDILDFTHRS